MIKSIVFLLAAMFTGMALGQSKELLNSSNIPEDLKKNSDAVIRYEKIECKVLSKDKVSTEYTYIITVLNHRGYEEAEIVIPYSKSINKINELSGTIYKSNGKKFKRISKADIIDVSAISGYSLFDDSRVIMYEPPIKTTPFTIEYSYTVESNGSLFLPSWSSFSGYSVAVEKSIFKVHVADGLNFKFHTGAATKQPTISDNNDGKTYTWEVNMQKAPKSEPYDISIMDQFPSVQIGLNEFEFYNTSGSQLRWKDLGNYISLLNQNRDEIPEKTKNEIIEITSGLSNKRDKIAAVYNYMQNKTHYVNVAVGIGGWQPLLASRVDEVKYGDCKALSNYTKSLLKAVGIESFYTIIKAGDHIPHFLTDFVSSQFNHVILCVPVENDTIWLECTSQKIPPGFLTTFTDNRFGLLIKGEQSKLVKTPELKGLLNGEVRKVNIVIHADLSANLNIRAQYSGEYEDEVYWWQYDDKDKQRRAIQKSLSFSDANLNSFKYCAKTTPNAVFEDLDIAIPAIATKMGNRIVLELNQLNKETYVPKKVYNRRSDIEIQRAMIEVDTLEYQLPEDFMLETNINPININSEFGSYHSHIEYANGRIIYIRELIVNKGIFEKSKYSDFVDFFKQVGSADNQKVLLKQETLSTL